MNNRKRLTKEEFIEKSNIKHRYRYNYDKVNYINNKRKVIITCNIHGDFEQVPKSHYLNGSGCIECSGLKRLDINSFIKKSNTIHDNKYSYDKSIYTNTNTKLIITCRKHGDFNQTPKSHLSGNGCSECSGLKRLTTSEFINRSKEIHGDKFLYDNIDYINMYKKVNIICKKHGIFKQIPSVHLNGGGCRKCKIDSMFSTKDIFIQNSKRIHNNLYDYDIVEYIKCNKKINIICKHHGIFKQTPRGHLNGRGCAQCSSSKGEDSDLILPY